MEGRPKPLLVLTSTDRILDISGWLCLGLLWAITIFAYGNLPEVIPTHFNAAGQADDEGSKMILFFLPVIGTLCFIGLTVLNYYPQVFNYPSNITAENAQRQYANAARMIRFLKLSIAFLFSALVFMVYRSAATGSGSIGSWFLPVLVVVFIIPLGYFTVKAMRNK